MSLRWIFPASVAVLTVVCFLPTLAGSFLNWDDNVNFLDSTAYQGLGPAQIRWAFASVLFGHYIPLTRLTWSVNYVLGGMDPGGYHLVNLLLHAGNALLVYVVARRLLAAADGGGAQQTRSDPEVSMAAALTALVFGLHPLRVEPVAWITARADLLCGAFALLTVWLYLRAVDEPARPRLLLVAAGTLAAALLSKGAALPLVAALFLLDVYPLRRLRRIAGWALVTEKVPILLVTVAGTALIAWALREGAVINRATEYGVVARVSVAAHSFVIFPIRFVWPFSLSPLYEMPRTISVLEPRFGLAVVAAAAVTAALVALRRRWPAGLAVWAFSALMLAPASAAVRLGVDLAPDRYSYLSGLGFAMLAGGAALGGIRLARRHPLARPVRWAGIFAMVVVLGGLGLTSWSYAEVWQDSEPLWRWAVELDPSCSVCHGKLGESVLGGPGGAARAVEAEGLFRRAIALRPDLPDAYFNLGTALSVQGRYREAEAPLRAYMEMVPHVPAGPERLGLLYLVQRRYDTALPLLRAAFVRSPDAPGYRASLAQALRGRAAELRAGGRGVEADELLAEARVLGPDVSTGSSARP
jgi:protein O-mannosyl-transferase